MHLEDGNVSLGSRPIAHVEAPDERLCDKQEEMNEFKSDDEGISDSKLNVEAMDFIILDCIDLTKDSLSQELQPSKGNKVIDESVVEPPVTQVIEKETNPRSASHKRRSSTLKSSSKPLTSAEKRNMIQMHKLWDYLPELGIFDMQRKIGEGTFSSVYLATLSGYPNQKFAIKHHVPTALPSRIQWEYKCLLDIGGKDNVGGIKTAFRRNDTTVFVMPYISHMKFSDYILDMGVAETREYIRGLLVALARVHSFDIIHRDVKPSNYLYDREARKYLLVDFGLACASYQPSCNNSNTPLLMEYKNKRKRENICPEKETTDTSNQPKRRALQTRRNDGNVKSVSTTNLSGQKPTAIENRPPCLDRLSQTAVRKKLFVCNENQQNECAPLEACLEPANNTLMQPKFTSTHKSPEVKESKLFLKPKENISITPCRSTDKVKGNEKLMAPRTVNTPSSAKRLMQMKEVKTPKENEHLMRPRIVKTPVANGALKQSKLNNAQTVTSQSTPKFQTLTPSQKKGTSYLRVQDSQVKSLKDKAAHAGLFASPTPSPQCSCYGKGRVCEVCMARQVKQAPRAGTPGFRPPEVLFKYPFQTTAVDIWAAGVVFLCIMSGCYPFFKSQNDVVALSEITVVFGSDKVKEIATKLGRQVQFSNPKKPLNIRKLCVALRRRRQEGTSNVGSPQCPECLQYVDPKEGCICEADTEESLVNSQPDPDDDNVFPASAYDLLSKLMDLNPYTRITAVEALDHPFFKV